MITLLADSNALRHPGLQAYLEASRDHAIALSDLVLVEMRKSKALATSRRSLQIASRFPQQVYVLRRTDQVLDEKITGDSQVPRLIDYEETIELSSLSRWLQTIPPPSGIAKHMAGLEADAQLTMHRLSEQVAALEPGLVDAAKDFTLTELTQLRTGIAVEDTTRYKLFALLKETVANFILQNQEPGRRAPMLLREAVGMFAFRYSLCVLIYYIEWVRIGRTTGKKLPRRVNDVVDMQIAAMGTFFNGVLSADENLQMVSNAARRILRSFGAYVGKDWHVQHPIRGANTPNED